MKINKISIVELFIINVSEMVYDEEFKKEILTAKERFFDCFGNEFIRPLE